MKCVCGFESRKMNLITSKQLKDIGNYSHKYEEDCWTIFPVPCQLTVVGDIMGTFELNRCPKCGTIKIGI